MYNRAYGAQSAVESAILDAIDHALQIQDGAAAVALAAILRSLTPRGCTLALKAANDCGPSRTPYVRFREVISTMHPDNHPAS